MDKHVHSMSPAYIHMRIDGKEINITKADLLFTSSNSSKYNKTMGEAGPDFLLSKGDRIQTNGTVVVSIVDTPDVKSKESIDHIKKNLKEAQNKSLPDKYTKDFLFTVENSAKDSIIEISFRGYVKEMKRITPQSSGFITYDVTVVMYDQDTFKIHE